MEPEAEELPESAAMEPYMNRAIAMMGGKDTAPAIEELAALPLEKRYVWRVASALKWVFADFDTVTGRGGPPNHLAGRSKAIGGFAEAPATSVLPLLERAIRPKADGAFFVVH
jgi:hypothetical protein